MSERLEVCTADGMPTGIVKSRDAIHFEGEWHRAVFVWIFDESGSVLLQRRAASQAVWPEHWDASVAGHVGAGESLETAAVREVAEELGLLVRPELLLRQTDHKQEQVHASGLVDREHHAVYLFPCDVVLEAYDVGPEVIEIGLVSLDDFTAFARGERETVPFGLRDGNRRLVARDEIVPYAPGYLSGIAEAIARQVSF